MRAARTDKGVSAVGQVVSLKMVVGFTNHDIISSINKHLPDQIRVLGYTKTTAGFDARKHCDKRRYEYVLPVWAFDPSSCRGRIDAEEAELAAPANPIMADGVLPSGSIANQPDVTEATAAEAVSDSPASSPAAAQQPRAQGSAMADVDLPKPSPTQALQQVIATASSSPAHASDQTNPSLQSRAENGPAQSSDRSGHLANSPALASAPQLHSTHGNPEGPAPNDPKRSAPASDTDQPSDSGFVFAEADVQRLSALLKQYEGTHNFHNFTVRLESTDPSAKRYMLSCKCTGVFEIQVSSWLFLISHARPASPPLSTLSTTINCFSYAFCLMHVKHLLRRAASDEALGMHHDLVRNISKCVDLITKTLPISSSNHNHNHHCSSALLVCLHLSSWNI